MQRESSLTKLVRGGNVNAGVINESEEFQGLKNLIADTQNRSARKQLSKGGHYSTRPDYSTSKKTKATDFVQREKLSFGFTPVPNPGSTSKSVNFDIFSKRRQNGATNFKKKIVSPLPDLKIKSISEAKHYPLPPQSHNKPTFQQSGSHHERTGSKSSYKQLSHHAITALNGESIQHSEYQMNEIGNLKARTQSPLELTNDGSGSKLNGSTEEIVKYATM
jgi:hypothetical protein